MTIENLSKVVPPPASPFEPFEGPWEPVEAALGLVLPRDYRDFARIYGCGYFMEFMGILTPRSSDLGAEFMRWLRADCSRFRSLSSMSDPIWPTSGGLLPICSTDNGDRLFWRPREAPQRWALALWDRGGLEGEDVEAFECDFTDFLAGLATGEIKPKAFPDDFYPFEPIFHPRRR